MTDSVQVTQIETLAREDGWSPLRRELDVRSFGINAWTAKEVGDRLINDHDEKPSNHEELYVVTAGRATFTVDGQEIDAPAGTVVYVRDPASQRGAVAAEAGSIVLAVGGEPGAVYKPRSWETNAQVFPLFERGEFDEARSMLQDALTRYDDRDALHYNLACAESRLGNTDAALEHLELAVENRPEFAEMAREDEDLASLRGDARFVELTGAS